MKISRSSFFLSSLLLFTAAVIVGCSAEQIKVTGVRTYSGSPAETESAGAALVTVGDETLSGTDKADAMYGAAGADVHLGDSADIVASGSRDSGNAAPNASTEAQICVFVCGYVAEPDVYYLPFGSRIGDAVEAAGGFLPLADREWLNLAEPLRDGERVQIFSQEETAEFSADGSQTAGLLSDGSQAGGILSGGSVGPTAGSGLTAGSDSAEKAVDGGTNSAEATHSVNINTAGKEELMTLPGIGESKAEAIIRYRDENGPFASPEDIMNVPGIKEAAYSKLSGIIAV